MNIEEARKVLWLKSNPHPLGDLLDEGYLTQERLEWAAVWAYNPKLKQAAQVILESKNNTSLTITTEEKSNIETPVNSSVETGMTIGESRTTSWPFSPYKGQPMGDLVDSRQISLKDLGYAVENAWNEKVKRAAMTLSLVRLDQVIKEPSPSEGYANLISGGRSYSERQETRWTMIQGFVFGVILTTMIAISLISTRSSPANRITLNQLISTSAGIMGLIFVLAGCVLIYKFVTFFMDFLTKRLDKKIEEYRFGQEGEDKVAQLVLQALDGNWNLVRNLSLPGSNKGDLDLVLVGPPGIWVLEVKNFRGEYRNTGDAWEYRNGRNWKPASVNPSRQALKNAVRLGNFLKADHINVFVTPVVVWANQENSLQIENPSVAVWSFKHLTDELGNIWHGEKLSEVERNKIVGKFSKLCDRQREAV